MKIIYNKCPECGYEKNNMPDFCPACGFDYRSYINDLEEKNKIEKKELAEKIRKEREERIKKFGYSKENNKIYFGSYYNKDDKTKEPIEWDILEEKDGKALIITSYIIDYMIFDSYSNNYELSDIRKWLNEDFYNNSFNEKEKNIVETTLVDNSVASVRGDCKDYVCNNTNDKLFLLSYAEAKKYYDDKKIGFCVGTSYAGNKGYGMYEDAYWLRSPRYWKNASTFYKTDNEKMTSIHSGVRPACWINLSYKAKKTTTAAKTNKPSVEKATKEASTKASSTKTTTTSKVATKPTPVISAKAYERKDNKIYFGSFFKSNDKTKEPIEWDILEEKNGMALIITHDVIFAAPFHATPHKKEVKKLFKSPSTIYYNSYVCVEYANNYVKSSIHKWLYDGFCNLAFNDLEKSIIQSTLVDNSKATTNCFNDDYICYNTNDKLFLLSYVEASKYLANGKIGKANGTPYAKSKGYDENYAAWWLRSPYFSSGDVSVVLGNQLDFQYVGLTRGGVRPACWIKLK